MKRRAWFLWFAPLLLVGAMAILKIDTPWMRDARFWLNFRNDWGERRARLASGFGAVDCGESPIPTWGVAEQKNLAKVDGCVRRNFRAKNAFQVTYLFINCAHGCGEIRAWNVASGLSVIRVRQGYSAGLTSNSEESCQDAQYQNEEAPLPNGNFIPYKTIGCK